MIEVVSNGGHILSENRGRSVNSPRVKSDPLNVGLQEVTNLNRRRGPFAHC
jgi:hypothetical protein